MKPRLLDLFSGAGGAAMGYYRAGFEVVGVDLAPQPNYPFEFWQRDALEVLRHMESGMFEMGGFDAIHASPPCPLYSDITPAAARDNHPDLVAPTRELLEETGLPWVMENVPGSPMRHQIVLCGSMFGLGANGRQLRRHRWFESNVPMMSPPCQHQGEVIGVYGTGGAGRSNRPSGGGGYKGTQDEYIEAMGIDWGCTRYEISQAIPPAYTEFIGAYLIEHLQRAAA